MSDRTESPVSAQSSAELPTATRRAVFAGVGAVGAVAALAACGSDGPPAGDPSSAPSSGAPAGPVAKTTDIPVGGGKVFPDAGVVITQPTANVFVGFSSICTHQSCVLSGVADGKINCACHFSAFDLSTGEVLNPPATKPLAARELKIDGEEISLA
jgi:Rieske Fe-S protein